MPWQCAWKESHTVQSCSGGSFLSWLPGKAEKGWEGKLVGCGEGILSHERTLNLHLLEVPPRMPVDIKGNTWIYRASMNTQREWKMIFFTLKLEFSVLCFLPYVLSHTYSSLSSLLLALPPFLHIPELNLMKMHKKCFHSMKCNPSTHTSYILCRNESISAGKADKSI